MNPPSHPVIRHAQAIDRWYRWVFATILLALPFRDNFWPTFAGTKALYLLSVAVACALFLYQGLLIEWVMWRHGDSTRWLSPLAYAARTVGLFAALVGLLYVVSRNFSHLGDVPVARLLGRDLCWVPPFAVCGMLARRRGWERSAEGLWAYPMAGIKCCAYGLFVVGLCSAVASYDPLMSLRDFRNDLGYYIVSTIVLLNTVRTRDDALWLLAVALGIGCYIAAINFLGYYRFSETDEVERLSWIANRVIYSGDYWFAPDRAALTTFDYRPMFPFDHHNRLSNFAMMMSGAGLVLATAPGMRGKRRALAFGGLATAFVLLLLTQVRGAWLAFALGLGGALALVFQWRRVSHWIALGCFVGALGLVYAVLPEAQHQRFARLFHSLLADEQRPVADDPNVDMNVVRRRVARDTAVRIIDAHPLLGIGYGYHVYERIVPDYQDDQGPADPQRLSNIRPHSHNNLLQVAAETGLLGLALYVGLHGLIVLMLFVAARDAHRQRDRPRWMLTAALALCLMMHAYGMTNYSLRYTLGNLFWLIMALLVVLAVRRREPVGPPPEQP